MTPIKIASAAALLGLFAMRGPAGCAPDPNTCGWTSCAQGSAPASTPAGKNCLHPIGPDIAGYGQRVADAVNATNGC